MLQLLMFLIFFLLVLILLVSMSTFLLLIFFILVSCCRPCCYCSFCFTSFRCGCCCCWKDRIRILPLALRRRNQSATSWTGRRWDRIWFPKFEKPGRTSSRGRRTESRRRRCSKSNPFLLFWIVSIWFVCVFVVLVLLLSCFILFVDFDDVFRSSFSTSMIFN